MKHPHSISDDRGALLVHVAVSLLAFIGLTTFIVDHGVFWTSRRQSQNSADAAAMSAAIAYAYDSKDLTDTGTVKLSAYEVARNNPVWGEPPSVLLASDITFPPCPGDSSAICFRVDVHRTTARGNPLPMFFGHMIGLTQQNMRATATAKVRAGNASSCLKPWAVLDKWLEVHPPPNDGIWDQTDKYDKYYAQGQQNGDPLPNPDVYRPPGLGDNGTGFKISVDYGQYFELKPGTPGQATSPGWFFALRLSEPGADEYEEDIFRCNNTLWGIGDTPPVEPGNMTGPTAHGTQTLIDLDPNARWNPGQKRVTHSCVGPPYTCSVPGYTESPRIVALPVIDTEAYEDGRQSGMQTIKVVNILGFFIESVTHNGNVQGYLMTTAGQYTKTKGEVNGDASFLTVITLVR